LKLLVFAVTFLTLKTGHIKTRLQKALMVPDSHQSVKEKQMQYFTVLRLPGDM